MPLGLINPQDVVLIPQPCYPPYSSATIFAQGLTHYLPLLEENAFLPQFDKISSKISNKAKLLFLNYPNNQKLYNKIII